MSLNLTKPLAFFDLEATGANFAKDRIVEIYVKKLLPNGDTEEFHSYINPKTPIPPQVTEIHGITDEMVADKPTFFKIAFDLESFLEGCDLAGFNSNRYDIPLLQEEFYRVGVEFDTENRNCIDAFKIFQKMERRDLKAALKFYCDKELEDAHSAKADVDATVDVLMAQMVRYDDLSGDMKELHEFSKEGNFIDNGRRLVMENGVPMFNFGKHKGKTVESVLKKEPQYYDWIMRSDFASDTKQKLTKIKDKLSGW